MGYASLLDKYVPNRKGPFSALVYGTPGHGKTTFALSFPNPVVVDTDRGLKAIGKATERLRLVGVTNPYETLMEFLRDAKNGTGAFAAPNGPLAAVKTIIIDSGTALVEEYLMPEIMRDAPERKTDGPKFEEFGRLKFRLQQITSLIKDISTKMNVVMTATAMTEKDEASGASYGRPNFMGGFREIVGALFDEEYFLEREQKNDGSEMFKLFAKPRRIYEGKTRVLAKTEFENPTYELLQANLKA